MYNLRKASASFPICVCGRNWPLKRFLILRLIFPKASLYPVTIRRLLLKTILCPKSRTMSLWKLRITLTVSLSFLPISPSSSIPLSSSEEGDVGLDLEGVPAKLTHSLLEGLPLIWVREGELCWLRRLIRQAISSTASCCFLMNSSWGSACPLAPLEVAPLEGRLGIEPLPSEDLPLRLLREELRLAISMLWYDSAFEKKR